MVHQVICGKCKVPSPYTAMHCSSCGAVLKAAPSNAGCTAFGCLLALAIPLCVLMGVLGIGKLSTTKSESTPSSIPAPAKKFSLPEPAVDKPTSPSLCIKVSKLRAVGSESIGTITGIAENQ